MRGNRGVRSLFGYGVSATNHQPNQDADMPLRETLTNTWDHIQGFLFPMLREEVGPLTAQHERLVVVLDVARVEAFALSIGRALR